MKKIIKLHVLVISFFAMMPLLIEASTQPDAPYTNVTVLAQAEVSGTGGETIRTTLADDSELKYSILRIEENVVGGVVVEQSVIVGDHIIVKLKEGKTQNDLMALNNQYGGTIRKALTAPRTYLVSFTNATLDTVPDAIQTYQSSTNVLYAEPDEVLCIDSMISNDTLFDDLWGLHNTGQTGGTPDYDIDAPEAWNISGGTGVVVAVLDSGIDYNHEDLHPNVWSNTGEIAGNGIDDDGNGYIDDIYGIDAVNNDSDPMDDNNHGTHCAGIIAAVRNNSTGVVGVAWGAKVMALKCFNSSGKGYVSDQIDCTRYVIMMAQTGVNVKVTSNSYSGTRYSSTLRDEIKNLKSLGIMVTAAAGNDGWDLDDKGKNIYPACYNEENVISVAAMDHNGNMPAWSNRGTTRVDLAAPGNSIISTVRNNDYAYMSGTSMATPYVAGTMALLFSYEPSLTVARAREVLLGGVDPLPGPVGGLTVTDGGVNAATSLGILQAVPEPVFQPQGGFYSNDVQVTISCLLSGADIYYTTNGMEPDQSSILYTNPVPVHLGTTLKARSYYSGKPESRVTVGEYLWTRSVIKLWNMNGDPGWTAEGLWQFGRPLGLGWGPDPASAATGKFVYGYNLSGNYEQGVNKAVTTTAIDCSNVKKTELEFKRWLCLNIGQSSIQISTNGVDWLDIWRIGDWASLSGAIRDHSWKTRKYDISSVADGQSTVYIRWIMGPASTFFSPMAGWNIDDVEISGSVPPPVASWAF